jgi:hypothetical protein
MSFSFTSKTQEQSLNYLERVEYIGCKYLGSLILALVQRCLEGIYSVTSSVTVNAIISYGYLVLFENHFSRLSVIL